MMGINNDTEVVVYSSSPVTAARVWWVLMYVGVKRVWVLNGGFREWKRKGFRIEKMVNIPTSSIYH